MYARKRTVEIEVVQPEFLERAVERGFDFFRLVAVVPELGRDEEFLALHDLGNDLLERCTDLFAYTQSNLNGI